MLFGEADTMYSSRLLTSKKRVFKLQYIAALMKKVENDFYYKNENNVYANNKNQCLKIFYCRIELSKYRNDFFFEYWSIYTFILS